MLIVWFLKFPFRDKLELVFYPKSPINIQSFVQEALFPPPWFFSPSLIVQS